ncbi:MAG TPA: SDR family oxidoreductase [Candidatus Nanoarchaeia archaeon]|nr:SDR family oxidoreductase [Candidatus Nanoarchaeia archaeon]
MVKVLVTGGAGFIGSHIVEGLLSKGYKVVVLDNLFSGKKDNLSAVKDKITFIEGDIRDEKSVAKAMKGIDHVLHQAARRSVPASFDDPKEYCDVNILGTITLLEAARKAEVKSFVFASSSSVYGGSGKIPQEELDPKLPLSPYAATKLSGEYYLKVYNSIYGMNTIALRYFNVFGPRQDPSSQYSAVIPLFITSVLKGISPTIHGDGEQSRDFTYVDNIVSANIFAMNSKSCGGEAFNIANGESISVNTVLSRINILLGKSLKGTHSPARQGDVRKTLADNSRAKKELSYKCVVDFDEGMKRTVEWYKQQAGAGAKR